MALCKSWDRAGVFLSVGCAVHCMVAPLVLLLAPVLGGLWVHPVSHLLIAACVLPIAGLALRRGFSAHHRRWVAVTGLVGMAFVALGTLLPFLPGMNGAVEAAGLGLESAGGAAAGAEDHVCHDCCPTLVTDESTGEKSLRVPPASIVTLMGGVSLVAAHMGNLRCLRGC